MIAAITPTTVLTPARLQLILETAGAIYAKDPKAIYPLICLTFGSMGANPQSMSSLSSAQKFLAMTAGGATVARHLNTRYVTTGLALEGLRLFGVLPLITRRGKLVKLGPAVATIRDGCEYLKNNYLEYLECIGVFTAQAYKNFFGSSNSVEKLKPVRRGQKYPRAFVEILHTQQLLPLLKIYRQTNKNFVSQLKKATNVRIDLNSLNIFQLLDDVGEGFEGLAYLALVLYSIGIILSVLAFYFVGKLVFKASVFFYKFIKKFFQTRN